MKLTITITASDAVSINGLPEEVVSSTKNISMELPVDMDDFIEAVETLITDNLTKAVRPLVLATLKKSDAAVVRMQKLGLTQPELLPPGASATAEEK
jgi:hypothetical protein